VNAWETRAREQGAVNDGIVPAAYTGIVYALDGVRFVAAATSRGALMRRVADYVRQRAGESLWGTDARHVHELLARAAHEDAIELYFAVVGQRWDEEWFVLADPNAS
jgi:hypothetical protein